MMQGMGGTVPAIGRDDAVNHPLPAACPARDTKRKVQPAKTMPAAKSAAGIAL